MMKCKHTPFLLIVALLLLFGNAVVGQGTKTISGTVTNAEQIPLTGVSVIANLSNTGTVTDDRGGFSLNVKPSENSLTISYVGYLTQVVAINGSTLQVQLIKDSTSRLSDVVVIGYGTVRKEDVTGSISTISQKDFQKGSITSFDQMISGKAPGISITSNGGHPGSGSKIRIRGLSSLSAGQDPLQVVDGAP
ncbi:MAG TPA: carboxypeptidase-like regulatory domain-containing protein, partial [Arachidicoccus sp.]|nr:carboxypeptidase-like regulatory domain-containing protein [Arachidicoccus sp.]